MKTKASIRRKVRNALVPVTGIVARDVVNRLSSIYETVILAEHDHREYAAAREALARFHGPKLALPV